MQNHTCVASRETIFFVVYGVIGVVIFIGNTFACVVFITTERLRKNTMNCFLISLAIWDILMSLLVVPFYAVFCSLGCEYSFSSYCWLMRGAKDCVKIATTLNLYAITYDRYIAVLQPLQYTSKLTTQRVAAILALVWLLPVLLAGVRNGWQHNSTSEEDTRLFNKIYDSAIVLGFVVLLVCLMLFTNVKIMRAIQQQAKRERREFPARVFQGHKGTIACIVVVLVFVICWIPRAVYNFSFIMHPPGLATPLFFRICFLFLFLQSSVNPFIYWFYRAEFRRAASSLMRCRLVRQRAESVLSTLRTTSFLSDTSQSTQKLDLENSLRGGLPQGQTKSNIELISFERHTS